MHKTLSGSQVTCSVSDCVRAPAPIPRPPSHVRQRRVLSGSSSSCPSVLAKPHLFFPFSFGSYVRPFRHRPTARPTRQPCVRLRCTPYPTGFLSASSIASFNRSRGILNGPWGIPRKQLRLCSPIRLALRIQSGPPQTSGRIEDSAEGRDRSSRVFNDGVRCAAVVLVATAEGSAFSSSNSTLSFAWRLPPTTESTIGELRTASRSQLR